MINQTMNIIYTEAINKNKLFSYNKKLSNLKDFLIFSM